MTFNPLIPYNVPVIPISRLKKIQKSLGHELVEAQVAIAKLSGFLSGLPDTQYALMNPIFLKEAVESSEIENINTTLLEVLQRQVAPTPDEKNSSQLVVNYFLATLWGMHNIDKYGLTSRLITGLQKTLLPAGAGEYRRVQVVIGDGRGKVHHTPPQAQHIATLISNWEKLVNTDSQVDQLVVAAAGHYQFEAIHPFEDGNGRTGRMLLTLHLMHHGLLSAPVVHISQYININKGRYYKLLRNATQNDELEPFIRYVIRGFAVQAKHSFNLLRRIQSMQRDMKHNVHKELPTIYSHELVEALFVRAVQTPVQLAKDINVHYVTASKYLKLLEKAGYLRSRKSGRNMFYINHRLLELIEQKSPMGAENDNV